eukprot:6179917-Pleurochrysis_carterae.AAC.1
MAAIFSCPPSPLLPHSPNRYFENPFFTFLALRSVDPPPPCVITIHMEPPWRRTSMHDKQQRVPWRGWTSCTTSARPLQHAHSRPSRPRRPFPKPARARARFRFLPMPMQAPFGRTCQRAGCARRN